MDTVFFMLTCVSLAFTEPVTQNGLMNSQNTSAVTGQDIVVNTTHAPLLNSSEHLTTSSLVTGATLTSAAEDNKTSTTSTSETATSSHFPTSDSTTAAAPLTNRTTLSTDVTSVTQTKTSAHHTELANVSHTTSLTVTTGKSSVINVTSQSLNSTQGIQLSVSDRNLTITFSVMLGIFAFAVVAIKLHRCSHKLQFLHQPLYNTEELNVSTAAPDTLVISGGLYDGHPIYDHVPPARRDDTQFRLEFLH